MLYALDKRQPSGLRGVKPWSLRKLLGSELDSLERYLDYVVYDLETSLAYKESSDHFAGCIERLGDSFLALKDTFFSAQGAKKTARCIDREATGQEFYNEWRRLFRVRSDVLDYSADPVLRGLRDKSIETELRSLLGFVSRLNYEFKCFAGV